MKNYEESSYLAYLKDISRYDVLSPEEEVALAKKVAEGDPEAKERFINCNLRLVVSTVIKYAEFYPLMDLIQEGNLGLMTAVEKFDYTRGYKFSTYAVNWIRQAVQRGVFGKDSDIFLPVHALEKVQKFKMAEKKFVLTEGYEPTARELAEFMGTTVANVEQYRRQNYTMVSMHAPIDDYGEICLGDVLESPDPGPEEKLVATATDEALYEAIDTLGQRERNILIDRWGLYDHETMTLDQLGRKYNLSKEGVRHVCKAAMGKLEKTLSGWVA